MKENGNLYCTGLYAAILGLHRDMENKMETIGVIGFI